MESTSYSGGVMIWRLICVLMMLTVVNGCDACAGLSCGCTVDEDCATGEYCKVDEGTCYAPQCYGPVYCLDGQQCMADGSCGYVEGDMSAD